MAVEVWIIVFERPYSAIAVVDSIVVVVKNLVYDRLEWVCYLPVICPACSGTA